MALGATRAFILIDINEPSLGDRLAEVVRECGMQPLFSQADGEQAADLAMELRCILTDYAADADDRSLAAGKLKALRQAYVGVPIIAVIEGNDAVSGSEALAAGAKDVIRRSALMDALAFRLDVLMAPSGHEGPARSDPCPCDAANMPAPPAAYLLGTPFETLTQRELDVMLGVVAGHANKMIAHRLSVSPKTVELHRARVMEKTGARTLSHLVRAAVKAGIDPKFDD
ncbi:MAG: LuxR C-terminal-related transcriptional regulator [Pseudomonadota bacterium]